MTDKIPLEKNAEEKLGAYLKRARMAAGIDQAELAREIRITPEMLDHLEQGRYDKLPVQAYVRGYLNTICTRLELDRAKVLDWYAGEVGRTYGINIVTDLGLDTAIHQSPERKNSKLMLILVIGLLLLLVALLNLHKATNGEHLDALVDSLDSITKSESLAALDSNADTTGMTPDSAAMDSSADSATDSTVDTTAHDTSVSSGTALRDTIILVESRLKLECLQDSTWIRVKKVGGPTWSRYIRAEDKPRYYNHADTMYVSLGAPEKVRVTINGDRQKSASDNFTIFNGKILEP
ncbi:MAG TPA: helix-turn-helix transcriptional regulator [Fibrobacteraceae bacterium]|nr:helix-turn-helix transcriptional regulator [Fibrobacteraceae bacterium]